MLGPLSRGACVLACVAIASVPTSAAWAETGDDEAGSSGSLAQQLAVALDGSLGDDATMALLRSYDRGFGPLETVQAAFQGELAHDGSLTDDGVAVSPSRPPTNLIDGQSTPKVERGIAKTTKRFDKLVDLAERAERFDVGDDAFMALVSTALTLQGYSPEQIIVDGFMGNGIFLEGKPGLWTGIKIVDENGKTVRPDGAKEVAETEEIAQQVDQFVVSVIDAVAGLDPRDGADLEIGDRRNVRVTMRFSEADGDTITVGAKGALGTPDDRGLARFVAGGGVGDMNLVGSCDTRKFQASGPLSLGMAGPITAEDAEVRIAITELELGGDLPAGCFGSLDLVEQLLMQVTFPPVPVEVRRGVLQGGRYSTPAGFEQSSGTVIIEVL